MPPPDGTRLIQRPIIIVAAPRSGSTLLFSILSSHPELWSLYTESNRLLEGPFHPEVTGAASNALGATELDAVSKLELRRAFFHGAGNLERIPLLGRVMPIRGRGRHSVARTIAVLSSPWKHAPIRMVEKSPKNSLRVPFMRALFPDARFIHLTRDPRSNIASLARAWNGDRHKTYPLPAGFTIRGYTSDHWSFMLQPGWERLHGSTVVTICADQWRACNEACLADLGPADLRIRYEDLVDDPSSSLIELARWADLDARPFERYGARLPVVQTTTPPDPEKWTSLRSEVEQVLPSVLPLARSLGYA